MKSFTVKELMVPLSEYATVSEDATLFEAVLALEKAQAEFDHTKYRHRGVIVLDHNKKVMGKLGQLDVLRALEPKYNEMQTGDGLSRLGFTKNFMKSMLTYYKLWDSPLEHICQKANEIKVSECVAKLSEGEHVDEDTTMDEAIHQLVLGHYQSLLVNSGDDIIGVLRLTDVFASIFHRMKECNLDG